MKFDYDQFIRIGAYLKKINERGKYDKMEDYVPFWHQKQHSPEELEDKIMQYYSQNKVHQMSELSAKQLFLEETQKHSLFMGFCMDISYVRQSQNANKDSAYTPDQFFQGIICIRTDYIYIEYYRKIKVQTKYEVETNVIKYEFFDLSRWAQKKPQLKQADIKFQSAITKIISPKNQILVLQFDKDEVYEDHHLLGTTDQIESIIYYFNKVINKYYI